MFGFFMDLTISDKLACEEDEKKELVSLVYYHIDCFIYYSLLCWELRGWLIQAFDAIWSKEIIWGRGGCQISFIL